MKDIQFSFIISISIVCLIIGIGIGYFISPYYQKSMYQKNDMTFGTADKWIDLRYINAMIAHHKGAILLAKQANKHTTRKEVVDLTIEILKNEPIAIEELYKWKKENYGDIYQVSDPTVENLGPKDTKSDLRFLNALINHHELGLLMTKEIQMKSGNSYILSNADAVDIFLKSGLQMLHSWRKNWYDISSPNVIYY
ncbi:MAG: DUF305 domain-containing protein [Candidatus Roizmanbacteria bacterium]